jgi:hypothetical protein
MNFLIFILVTGVWIKVDAKEIQQKQVDSKLPYQGVTLKELNPPPHIQKLSQEENYITWTGFQDKGNGGNIFIQSTKPLEYEEIERGKRLRYILKKCKIYLKNNQRPLITKHFNTPVLRVYLKPKKQEVILTMDLRLFMPPTIKRETKGGYHFLIFEFPKGKYIP